ncbi:condensation domain-containing protein [Streptomyces radiopugnans]|nr:condensation domain-containing protein [Streptomyces radiopugnans]
MSDSSATVLPLTANQAGIWYAQSLSGPNATFHAALCLEIAGAVDPQLFVSAMRRVVTEAEALRARFTDDGTGPVQVVEPVADWSAQPLHVLDFSAEDRPEQEAEAWMWSDANTPVDVFEGPLYRFALIKVAADRFFFYHRYHHLVMDGFGANLVAARLAEVYTRLVAGEDPTAGAFPPLRELIDDESAYRRSAGFETDRDFWTERFADKPAAASLGDRPTGLPTGLVRGTRHVTPGTGARIRDAARAVRVGWLSRRAGRRRRVHRPDHRQQRRGDRAVGRRPLDDRGAHRARHGLQRGRCAADGASGHDGERAHPARAPAHARGVPAQALPLRGPAARPQTPGLGR